jgi:hypothetical protein
MLVSSVRLATSTLGVPVVSQGLPNAEPQSLVEPPQAANASVNSAESHLSLHILFT